MTANALTPPQFVRRTRLRPDEYRKNFHQIDADVISAVTSEAADRVTPLMSKIYLRLTAAPTEFWESDGVLYFCAKGTGGRPIKASKVLYEVLGVSSATAHKALAWMHGQGIIGYFSGKNGAGIRIFLNRAARSIGVRPSAAGKKILPFGRGSNCAKAGSSVEPAFNDSFAVSEVLDTDLIHPAPKNGADTKQFDKSFSTPTGAQARQGSSTGDEFHEVVMSGDGVKGQVPLKEIISRLRDEIEPIFLGAAARAAAQATRSELERTRTWFETKALPKAVRVAQSECYSLLKKHGTFDEKASRLRAGLDLGRHVLSEASETGRPSTPPEVGELAEVCLALLETHGQSIDVTLSKMSAEGGGWLLAEDSARVRAAAELMLAERERRD